MAILSERDMPVPNLLLAYIDAGTGAILLQAFLAILLTCGVFFRRILFAPFRLLFKGRQAGASEDPQELPPSST